MAHDIPDGDWTQRRCRLLNAVCLLLGALFMTTTRILP